MGKKKRKSLNPPPSSLHLPSGRPQQLSTTDNCFQGEILDRLMHELCKGVESAEKSRGGLSEKIWIKQQFCIGVNDVTRVLERMPRTETGNYGCDEHSIVSNGRPPQSIRLQAILVAADCSPKLLTKHIPGMAASRRVPVIYIKDNKGGSFRLGALVKLKTSLSIGIKAKGSRINQIIDKFLRDNGFKASDDVVI